MLTRADLLKQKAALEKQAQTIQAEAYANKGALRLIDHLLEQCGDDKAPRIKKDKING